MAAGTQSERRGSSSSSLLPLWLSFRSHSTTSGRNTITSAPAPAPASSEPPPPPPPPPPRDEIITALSGHAYHLPGNTGWTSDIWQYVTNNHPVMGIVCHHQYHLFTTGPRIIALVGSVGFGLIVTNCIYLAFVFTNTTDSVHVEFQTNITRTGWHPDFDDSVSIVSISNVNLVLWTIGAFIHGLFDTVIWSLAASGNCCLLPRTTTSTSSSSSSSKSNNASSRHPPQQNEVEEGDEDSRNRRKRCLGIFVMVELVIFVTAVATLSVALRAALDSDDESIGSAATTTTVGTTGTSTTTEGDGIVMVGGGGPDTINTEGLLTSPPTTTVAAAKTNLTTVQDILSLPVPDTTSDYEFLVAYMIELGLSYFLYNPVIAIVLFSGILSCGTTPVLGGWPYEMKQEREVLQQQHRANSSYTLNTSHTVSSHLKKQRSTTNRSSRPFDIEEEEIQPHTNKPATPTNKPARKSKPALRTIKEPEQSREARKSMKSQTFKPEVSVVEPSVLKPTTTEKRDLKKTTPQQNNERKVHATKRPSVMKKMTPANKINRVQRTADAIFDEVSEECS